MRKLNTSVYSDPQLAEGSASSVLRLPLIRRLERH
jgi:hypothetical protein